MLQCKNAVGYLSEKVCALDNCVQALVIVLLAMSSRLVNLNIDKVFFSRNIHKQGFM